MVPIGWRASYCSTSSIGAQPSDRGAPGPLGLVEAPNKEDHWARPALPGACAFQTFDLALALLAGWTGMATLPEPLLFTLLVGYGMGGHRQPLSLEFQSLILVFQCVDDPRSDRKRRRQLPVRASALLGRLPSQRVDGFFIQASEKPAQLQTPRRRGSA